MTTSIQLIAVLLIIVKFIVFLRLERLNMGVARKHQQTPPTDALVLMGEEKYQRSLAYTLAKARLNIIETLFGNVLLLGVLFSGVLGWWFALAGRWSTGIWADSLAVFALFMVLGWLALPFSLYKTFRLEVHYGFNTTTWQLYVKDFIKSFVLSSVFTIPLLAAVFWLFESLGTYWWVYGAALALSFQFLMQLIFPRFILPLFNKLSPLAEGELRTQLLELARRTEFQAKNILVMDGSKRSRHSNAFFTGLGRSRMVVLFDTLVQQLSVAELKAVLAHEVGHYKHKHILKGMLFSVCSLILSFYVLSLCVEWAAFSEAFALSAGEPAHALVLIGMLSGTLTFYFKPFFNALARKHEYEADAYAKTFTGAQALGAALKKLYKENLANLHPHPAYSFFYYSHPTLQERITRLS